jgi:hypothetical protein
MIEGSRHAEHAKVPSQPSRKDGPAAWTCGERIEGHEQLPDDEGSNCTTFDDAETSAAERKVGART